MRKAHYTFFLTALMLCSVLSGCLGNEEIAPDQIEEEAKFGAYSVVAPVDTGINVYHERFILNETLPQWLLDGLGDNVV